MISIRPVFLIIGFFAISPLLIQSYDDGQFKPIFNGKNFKGWYSFVEGYGKNNDPLKVFQVEPNGIIHVSGEKFGYLCTEKEFKNFHIRLEFKWGEKKWEPRLSAPRDSGLLYDIPMDSTDKVWPCGIELQIQEGDTGDLWMISKATIVVDGVRTTPGDFVRAAKKEDAEHPHGEWNTVEAIVKDGHCQHIVNGVLVNEGSDASILKGRVLIQSEGAEIYFRNIVVKEL